MLCVELPSNRIAGKTSKTGKARKARKARKAKEALYYGCDEVAASDILSSA